MSDKLIIDAVYGADVISNSDSGTSELAVNLRGRVCDENSTTTLTDTTKSWTTNELIDYQVFNTADGSSGTITSNTDTTVTVTALTGGADKDFLKGNYEKIH